MFKKFNSYNLKKKMNFGYKVLIVFMMISGIISIAALAALNGSLNDFVNKTNRADSAVKVCQIEINNAARNINEMILNDDPFAYSTYRSTIEENLQVVETELKALRETGVVSEKQCTQYEDLIHSWSESGLGIVSDIESGNVSAAISRIFTECAPKMSSLTSMADRLDGITGKEMDNAIFTNTVVFIVCVVSIVLFVAIATLISLRISKKVVKSVMTPISEIEKAAEQIAEGNLHYEIDYANEDELGVLANSLRESIKNLSSYVEDIAYTMNEFANGNFDVKQQTEWKGDFVQILDSIMVFEQSIAETVRGIQGVADQVTCGAEQIADSSNELATGATEQASVTEELTATIETASSELFQSADIAKAVGGKVEASGVQIVKSDEKMQEMLLAMKEINDASEKIRQIIDTINDIASQTNLLALNASIEAARAGEAGKGFAVVADQVSILASQSAQAAQQSNVLIDSSLMAVDKGIVIANDTAKQLKEVVKQSNEITEDINQAAESLKVQAESFKQIMVGVEHINDVVQTNSATSEECAAASQEMNSQAENLGVLLHKFTIMQG